MINKIIYKTLACTILLITTIGMTHAQTLVWEEDFNTTVNPTKWTYDFGNGSERDAGYGWGNSELEYYTSRTDNARIENGSLVIEAKQEAFQGSAFTSARLKTEGRVHFKYGTVEARMKLPNLTKGLWPAFWTLGTIGGSWPSIGEIDMMESGSAAALAANNGNKSISSAAHWSKADGSHDYNVSSTTAAVDLSLDYHLYKMVWTPQYIKMYLDNVEYYSFDISNPADPSYNEFHTPHFLLLNLAVGGAYTGIYNAAGITAPLPGKMYVDYIRLYQNPDGVLNLAENTALSGNFGVLTDNTPVTAALTYGTNAELYYWNNLTNIPNPVPYEGANVWAVHANAGAWFGMGVQNEYRNLSNFANGALRFRYKSTYTGQFKIGVKTGHGESWINFAANSTAYGLLRNGTWSEVIIPLSEFQNPSLGRNIDLYTLKNAFMFAGDPATSAADFYFDDVYYSGGVAANPPPTVSITSPTHNAIITTPNNLVINADAADANGTVTQVEFFNGTTSLGMDATSPYSVTLTTPSVGTYILTAKATDNEGAMTTSTPITVFVSSPTNNPPTANITSPANNAAFLTPSSITINATATDADGSIFKVEFYKDATLLGTSTTAPYTYTWTGAPVGNYALTVKATDNGGLTTTSSVVNIVVSNPIKPTVSITSPTNNSSFVAPASITINADAADANGTVTMVDFYNGTTLIGTDATSPYSFTWNNVAIGNYILTAKAMDNDGNETVSTAVNIAVNVAPTPGYCGTAVNGDYAYKAITNNGVVTFTFHPLSPIAGCNLAIIYIREGASGGYGGYGMTQAGTDFVYTKTIANNTPLSIYFTYNTPPAGERNSLANPHSYTVGTNCTGSTNTPPTVSITSPANNATFTQSSNITINANATDADGTIASVEFYQGSTLIGTDNTAPYSIDWLNVPAGNYTISAKATDNGGLTTISALVNIVVNIDNSAGYCGTLANGDYSYRFEVISGQVVFTFHPLGPVVGSNSALIYIREGGVGGYGGYGMTPVGGDFRFTKTIANGTPLSIYFTYNVPGFGDRNSSATPHSYTVGTSCLASNNVTITAAPVPTRPTANVISLFSNTYTDVTGTDWFPNWGQSTVVEDTLITGNATKKYTNFNYQGVQFASPINASTMQSLHIDLWTPNCTAFEVYLINTSPALVEQKVTLTPTLSGWNSYDIPLSSFNTIALNNIGQFKFVGTPFGTSKVYLDNIYFYNAPSTSSITAAPTPTRAAANVISLYSNAYTNRTVDTWSAVWDNADVTDTIISGNDTKIYSNLNFAGIEFTSNVINATAMTHFHIDIWTPNSTTFKVKLVDFGANGVYDGGGDDKEHELTFTPTLNGWVSYDLPLSDFVNMTTRAHLAQLILVGSNSKVYVDNVYFYNNTVISIELTDFKVKLQGNTAVLDWQTASERNNKGFGIECSATGTDYKNIGEVKGNGTTNLPHNYTFIDSNPLDGINYYRLRQMDFDGKETLSKYVSIVFIKSGLVVKTTLISNILEVSISDEKATTLSIFNIVGQQVFVAKVRGTQRLDISSLANGLYIIATDKGETGRFVKE